MTSRPVPPSFILATETPVRTGSRYPVPYNEPCMARTKHILGDVFGLKQFGVNLVLLPPGSWSSQRHWHEKEDEFIYIVEGEITLFDNSGEHLLTPGMCAGFRAGNPNAHCLKNSEWQACTIFGSRHACERGSGLVSRDRSQI